MRRLSWILACEDVPLSANALELRLDGATAWRKVLDAEDVVDERLGMTDELDTTALEPGRHDMEIRILDAEGNVLFSKAEPLEVHGVKGSRDR